MPALTGGGLLVVTPPFLVRSINHLGFQQLVMPFQHSQHHLQLLRS